MTTEEIRALPKPVRLAGYLTHLAALDEFGAKLRTSKEDEQWTAEEENKWDALVDEIDPWWYSLSQEEKKLVDPITNFMSCLCRGENPEEHIKLTCHWLANQAAHHVSDNKKV